MAKVVYECMFILDSNKYARNPGEVANGIGELISKCGGEVLVNRLWNEQKLAYAIDGHRKGTYWLSYFRMESTGLTNFNRQCQLNEAVVRFLTLKVDYRLVEVLVQHALGGTIKKTVIAADVAVEPELEGEGEVVAVGEDLGN